MMGKKVDVRVLLVEDNDLDARRIRDSLEKADNTVFHISRSQWLNDAITAAKSTHFDAVVLDLSLYDSLGIDTLVEFMKHVPGVPIIVTTGIADIETAIRCVEYGAQDYLVKEEITPWVIERSIRYAIERKKAELVEKQLIRESIAGITGQDIAKNGTAAVLSKHAKIIAESVEEVLDYLRKNSTGHHENVTRILERHGFRLAVRAILSASELEDTGQFLVDELDAPTKKYKLSTKKETVEEQASSFINSKDTNIENPDVELLSALKNIRNMK